MFPWQKNKSNDATREIRETLFGDMPIVIWAPSSVEARPEPWNSFQRARIFIESPEKQNAISILQNILSMPELESRCYLQAHHFLAELGVQPSPEKQKDILGVVVEVGMKNGTDLVAGYADHSARYYNHRGGGIVWERPNDSLDAPIDALLRSGGAAAQVIGPWKKPRRPPPSNGHVRLNLLTRSGIHFGEGAMDVFAKDKLGGPIIAAALQLMQKMIQNPHLQMPRSNS